MSAQRFFSLVVTLACAVFAVEAFAVDTHWTNNTGSDWDTDALWNTGAEPTGGDDTYIGSAAPGVSPANVTVTQLGEVANRLSIGNGGGNVGTLNISSGSLNAPAESWIGRFGTGNVNQTGGTVTFGLVRMGRDPGAAGSYTLGGGTLNAAELSVGFNAPGTFVQNGGAVAAVGGNVYVGENSGGSSYTLNAGTVNANRFNAGVNGGSTGNYTQTGGILTGNWVSFGVSGTSNFNMSSGTINAGELHFGRNGGGNGSGTQSGGTINSNWIGFGEDGGSTGNLTVSGGAIMNATGGGPDGDSIRLGNNGTGTITQMGGTITATNSVSLGRTAGTGTLHLNGGAFNVTAGNIINGGGTANINISGGTLTVQGGAAGSVGADTLRVGVVGNGAYSQGGTQNVSVGTFSLGDGGGFTGNYTLAGSGTLTMTNESWIGRFGTGTLTQSGTTILNAGLLRMGRDAPGVGTYTMNNGTANISEFTVGYDGIGNVVQHNGTVNVTNDFRIRQNAGAGNSSYTINGGTLNQTNNDFIVGAAGGAGVATFTQNGGTVSTNLANAGSGDPLPNNWTFIGLNGTGVYNITGGTLDADNSTLVAIGRGNGGNGTLTQNNNTSASVVDAREMWIGWDNGSQGTYNISAGTLNVDDRLGLGRDAGGVGAFNQSGGTVGVVNNVFVGEAGTATLTLSSGTFNANSNVVIANLGGAGTLNVNGGTMNVAGNVTNGAGTATINISGGTLAVQGGTAGSVGADTLSIGVVGNGAYAQGGTQNVTVGTFSLGDQGGRTGNYTLAGSGTLTMTNESWIGRFGTGTLTQSGTTMLNAGLLRMGRDAPGVGTYTMNNGTANISEFTVGYDGIGNVVQHNGTVNVTNDFRIRQNAGAGNSSYTINGGTLNQTNNDFIVGAAGGAGVATFTQNGGTVSTNLANAGSGDPLPNNWTFIGLNGTGVYNITGGTLDADNSTLVAIGRGNGGNGTLTQNNNTSASVVDAREMWIGWDNGSQGTYNISAGTLNVDDRLGLGRDPGSVGTMNVSGGTVNVTNNMFVGVGSGANNLVDQDAGDVNVGGSLIIAENANSRGTYDISGGTLDVGVDISVGLNGGTGANPARFNVSGNSAVTANRIVVGQNAGSNGRMDVSGTSTITGTGATPSMRIGENGTGVLNQSGGTINMPWVTIGTNGGGTGTYNMSGGTLNATEIHAGRSGGTGTIVQTGGDVNANWAALGADGGSNGVYNISAGTLDVTTSLEVGGKTVGGNGVGTGTLSVSGTGAVTVGDLRVVPTAGSTGTVNQTGGTINVTNATTYTVGNNDTGTVTLNAPVNAPTYVGPVNAAGTGTVNHSGGITNVTGHMLLGDDPNAGPIVNNYNLSAAGDLNFGDTTGNTGHHTNGTNPSAMIIFRDAAFNFTGGTLRDVTHIDPLGGGGANGTFTQQGGSFIIGQNEGLGDDARTTFLYGAFNQTNGIVHFDAFGPELTPLIMTDIEPIDLLIATDPSTLDGLFDIDYEGFTPVFGDIFSLMKAPTIFISNDFAIIDGFARVIPDGMGGMVLQAIVPEPGTVAIWSLLAMGALIAARKFRRSK